MAIFNQYLAISVLALHLATHVDIHCNMVWCVNTSTQNLMSLYYYYYYHYRFTSIIQVNLCQPAPPVKNWRILLEQSYTAYMPLLMATSAFRLRRRRWSSPQRCLPAPSPYHHCV